MPLTNKDVHKIAHLARIHVDGSRDDEKPSPQAAAYLAQLNDIIGLIDELQAADTAGVEPMAHPQDVYLRLRDDVVSEPDRRAAFQAVAPQTEAGLYLVPKVIE